MRKLFAILALAASIVISCTSNSDFACATVRPSDIPDSVYVGGKMFHVQGLAIDRVKGYMYFSFTSQFFKTDLQGNVLASIDRVQGHLGAMTLSPVDGKVYASLECKDDEIGVNISKRLDVKEIDRASSVFYIAVIDVDKLTRLGMDPELDGVMTTVCVKEACADYQDQVPGSYDHRFACSGIDGVTFAPAIGHKSGKKVKKWYLYVAYGVYGDTTRCDNDYNVLLRYDVADWSKYETPVVFGQVHTNGPEAPLNKYFVYTGNTTWGVQNMAYDRFTNRIYMAVYKGKKPQYPNYNLFAVDCAEKPFMAPLKGVGYCSDAMPQLSLAKDGLRDESSDTYGWRFKWGSTGLCSVGGGWWIISEKGKNEEEGTNSCTARLYHWTGDAEQPFE